MSKILKKITFVMIIITGIFFFGLGGFSKTLLAETTNTGEMTRGVYLNIMTCTKPQYDMLNSLSKGRHNVEYMFTSEKQMADYKITKEAINNVSNMNLFLYSGAGYEKWMNQFTSNLNKSKVSIVDLSRGIRNETYIVNNKREVNPYYWTGPSEYEIMLYNAKSALQEKDPANRQFYENNYNEMIQEVNKMVNEFEKNISEYNNITFLTRNNNFVYLLGDLGINYKVVPSNTSFKEYVQENNINQKDVYIIKDKGEKINTSGFNSVTLESYNGNISYMELLQNNINSLEKTIGTKIIKK